MIKIQNIKRFLGKGAGVAGILLSMPGHALEEAPGSSKEAFSSTTGGYVRGSTSYSTPDFLLRTESNRIILPCMRELPASQRLAQREKKLQDLEREREKKVKAEQLAHLKALQAAHKGEAPLNKSLRRSQYLPVVSSSQNQPVTIQPVQSDSALKVSTVSRAELRERAKTISYLQRSTESTSSAHKRAKKEKKNSHEGRKPTKAVKKKKEKAEAGLIKSDETSLKSTNSKKSPPQSSVGSPPKSFALAIHQIKKDRSREDAGHTPNKIDLKHEIVSPRRQSPLKP